LPVFQGLPCFTLAARTRLDLFALLKLYGFWPASA
jgi:hypothetical protein